MPREPVTSHKTALIFEKLNIYKHEKEWDGKFPRDFMEIPDFSCVYNFRDNASMRSWKEIGSLSLAKRLI